MALHPTVAIVGATGAVGSATAAVLARRGAQLVLLARPSGRLDDLVKRLGGGDRRITSVPLDLASQRSVRAAARILNDSGGHVDALLNAAGLYLPRYKKTPDGLELMLAVNLLGPFLLTNLVRDRLAGGGRVITVAAPSTARVDFASLLDKSRFHALRTFAATKAAGLMFTFELARRAKRWDVRSNAFHPGLVRSQLMRESPTAIRLATRLVSGSADKAAQDLAELAISPAFAGTTGWFFKGTRRIDPPKHTADLESQDALWRRCAELVELDALGF